MTNGSPIISVSLLTGVCFSPHGAYERIVQRAADVGIEAVDDLVLLVDVLGAGVSHLTPFMECIIP